MAKRKRRGHFCWSCQQVLPNEKFSGKGHARHLCKKCSRLGKEELEVRQALRNLERCLDDFGHIRRRHRKQFESFLVHPNARIRQATEEIQESIDRRHQEWVKAIEADRAWIDSDDALAQELEDSGDEPLEPDWGEWDDELPF